MKARIVIPIRSPVRSTSDCIEACGQSATPLAIFRDPAYTRRCDD